MIGYIRVSIKDHNEGRQFGLPPLRPRAWAVFRTVMVRSRIVFRSNSANTDSIPNMALPAAVPVLILS